VDDFATALKNGTCGIGPITLFDTGGYRTRVGAQVNGFDARQHIPSHYSLKRMSRADRMEALALERCFTGAHPPVVTSTKGALGENFASGGLRSAAMALGIRSGRVPPTLGLTEPITPLAMVSADSREMPVGYGMVNACASGGTFVSLLLKKP